MYVQVCIYICRCVYIYMHILTFRYIEMTEKSGNLRAAPQGVSGAQGGGKCIYWSILLPKSGVLSGHRSGNRFGNHDLDRWRMQSAGIYITKLLEEKGKMSFQK